MFIEAPAATQKTFTYKGKEYDVPSLQQLEEWMEDGGTETPDGEWVEPDAPEGWLCLLGLI